MLKIGDAQVVLVLDVEDLVEAYVGESLLDLLDYHANGELFALIINHQARLGVLILYFLDLAPANDDSLRHEELLEEEQAERQECNARNGSLETTDLRNDLSDGNRFDL